MTTLKYCHVDVTDISAEAVSDLMQRYLSMYIHIMTPRSKFGPSRLWMRLSRLYEEKTVKKEYINYGAVFIGMNRTLMHSRLDIYQIFNDL